MRSRLEIHSIEDHLSRSCHVGARFDQSAHQVTVICTAPLQVS